MPIGVPGELYIGGRGVASGYLNRPELTAERFVPDTVPGRARMYRTGDLGRWRADGTIECLGRIDHQVKVRGYRIELGEIETVLVSHASVGQAVVVARRTVRATFAWSPTAYRALKSGMRAVCGLSWPGSLPEYMVPQHFVRLQALPLTPSGKVDRKALPAPVVTATSGGTYVAPRTPTETMVAGLWEKVLGLARIGVDDDFFTLGGHSLLVAQVLSRLNREHGIVLPFRSVFEAPTVAGFATLVDERSHEDDAAADRFPGARKPGPHRFP